MHHLAAIISSLAEPPYIPQRTTRSYFSRPNNESHASPLPVLATAGILPSAFAALHSRFTFSTPRSGIHSVVHVHVPWSTLLCPDFFLIPFILLICGGPRLLLCFNTLIPHPVVRYLTEYIPTTFYPSSSHPHAYLQPMEGCLPRAFSYMVMLPAVSWFTPASLVPFSSGCSSGFI